MNYVNYLLGRAVIATLALIVPPDVDQLLYHFLLAEFQHCQGNPISGHNTITEEQCVVFYDKHSVNSESS